MASFHSYFSLLLILALSLSELDVSLARRSLFQSTGSISTGSLTPTGSKTTSASPTKTTTTSASPTKTTSSASPIGLTGSTSPSKPKSTPSSTGPSGLGGLSKPAGSGIGLAGSTGSGHGLSSSTSPAISTPTPATPKPGFPFPMPDLKKIVPDILALNKDLVDIIRGIRSGNTAQLPQIVKNLIPHFKKLLGDLPKPKPAAALPAANTVQPALL